MMTQMATGQPPLALQHSLIEQPMPQNLRRRYRAFDTQFLAAVSLHERLWKRIGLVSDWSCRNARMTIGQFGRIMQLRRRFAEHSASIIVFGRGFAYRNASTMAHAHEALAGASQRMATARLERRRIAPGWSGTRARELKVHAALPQQDRESVGRFQQGMAPEHAQWLAQRQSQDLQLLRYETGVFEQDLRRLGEEHWRRAGVSMFRNPGQRRLKDRSLIWYEGTPARVQEVLVMARMRVPAARLVGQQTNSPDMQM